MTVEKAARNIYNKVSNRLCNKCALRVVLKSIEQLVRYFGWYLPILFPSAYCRAKFDF